MTDGRKEQESAFHDRYEHDRNTLSAEEFDRKHSNRKWYAVTRRSHEFIEEWLRSHVAGKRVLDYCCGAGGASLQLAELGATVHGIDISAERVASSARLLQEAGFGDRSSFTVMDAEHTTFPDGHFDVVVCFGVLHHLDTTKAFRELARIVKPNGFILAAEPLAYNPLINAYRRFTPHLRTEWEAEHILTGKDLNVAKSSFRSLEVRYFHLFDLIATPLRNYPGFSWLLGLTNWIDSWVLQIPGLRLMAWQMVFVLAEPQKHIANAHVDS